MECREARERLPLLHRGDGLPAGEVPAIEAHLADCTECRDHNRALRDAVDSLRAGLADLGAEPPGEEEVMEMLADLKRETRRSRLVPIAAAAAVLLISAGITALLLLGRRGEDGLFAEGPQVADAEGVKVQPPLLRIPRGKGFDNERHRLLVTVRDGVYTMRLSYEPEDGKGRVRTLNSSKFATPPAPADGEGRGVLLLAADPETPWREVWWAARMFEPIELYLAGREPGGKFGALPIYTGQGVKEIIRMGASVAPNDLARYADEGAALELRITREPGGTRYRFGLWPDLDAGNQRFALGDESVPDPELASPEGDPVPRSLTVYVDSLKRGSAGLRGAIFLQVGTGVRYVDVLRAVECAGGSETIIFVEHPSPRRLGRAELPAPLNANDAALLVEDLPKTLRAVVTVDERGRTMIRGMLSKPEAIDSAAGSGILLRADGRAPWDACAAVLARARAAGKTIRIAFAPEDPAIGWERALDLHTPAPGATVTPIHLTQGGIVPKTEGATAVKVVVPDGATAGEVIPRLLRLARLGIRELVFE